MSPDVLIVMGSKSDAEVGKKAASVLSDFGVDHKMVVASAHRTPDHLRELVRSSDAKVFIAIAGLSAALPGTIAAYTTKPVIGVPVSGKVNLDSILSITQMPPGIPVAAVGKQRDDCAGGHFPGDTQSAGHRRPAGHTDKNSFFFPFDMNPGSALL